MQNKVSLVATVQATNKIGIFEVLILRQLTVL